MWKPINTIYKSDTRSQALGSSPLVENLLGTKDSVLVTKDNLLGTDVENLLGTDVENLLGTFVVKNSWSLSSSPSPSNENEEWVETVEKDGDRTNVDTLPVVTL